ncbi:unnamed protein product [Clavelina lepadiformis]|uniref:MYND-type domain-containing protein n=1 Tax=Clavelina lepadiformis TaxID=159417 RepID=A0ABP0H270_CLALP
MVGGTTAENVLVCQKKGHYIAKKWFSFADLDNFDSDHLISTLCCQTRDGLPFLWTSSDMENTAQGPPLIALRQAEAVFNLSQLMFALYHGSVTACTFFDLQYNRPPRDIRKNGFNKLDNCSIQSGSVFRRALHILCWNITEAGGLLVIFSMMKNPVLPIIRQKCLDALTNVLCVDNIEKIVLRRQPWFLKKLISMVEQGDLQCDMVPAISVLDRLVVVILSEKLENSYQQLMELKFIDMCLNGLQCATFTCAKKYLHFVKFQTIAMQAIALLCADGQSKTWSSELQERVFTYCFRSVLLWNTDQPPTDPVWHQSESFYSSMSFSSSALLFAFVVLIHAVLKWPSVHSFLKSQAIAFKYQLSKILTLESLESMYENADSNSRIIINAVEWLWKNLYSATKTTGTKDLEADDLCPAVLDPLPELCEKVLRCCSYRKCSRRETEVNEWKSCENCGITCYCSDACRIFHKNNEHGAEICQFLSMRCNEAIV